MTAQNTAVRPSWDAVPAGLREAVESRTGPVLGADSAAGGFTPGLAVRLQPSETSVFVKALPDSHPLASSYKHEAEVAGLLPGSVPAPRVLWCTEEAGYVVIAFEAVDGRHADFTSEADLRMVLDSVEAVHVPVDRLPEVTTQRSAWLHGWGQLATDGADGLDPWAQARLQELAGIESAWLESAPGNTLLHGDLRADNILITGDGAVIVDWSHASTGNPALDLLDLVPQLILAGLSTETAENWIAGLEAWQKMPAEAVTSYAAAITGYWTRSSRLPSPPDSPHLRKYQASAAAAGVEWLRHRLG